MSSVSYKPIRDQILQMEHLKLAFALEFLDACGIRKSDIKLLRTDAIILSTPRKKMEMAKQGLVNVTRRTLNEPKHWLFPQDDVMSPGGSGCFAAVDAAEGEIFRVFNCELPTQQQNGVLFNQKIRTTPHVMPPVEVFRAGETDVVEKALQLTRESGLSVCMGHLVVENPSSRGNAWSCWTPPGVARGAVIAQTPPGLTLRVVSSIPLKHFRG